MKARTRASARPKKCCVRARGQIVACFTGKDAARKASALQRIVKRSKTAASCELSVKEGLRAARGVR